MDKKSKIALFIISFVIVLMMVAEVSKPKAINWRDSYTSSDKIPLGCFVLFNELETFSKGSVLVNNQNIYEYLKSLNDNKHKTLLFINNSLYFDIEESEALLNFVAKGNTVFLSTNNLNGLLADTLKINISETNYELFKKPSIHKFSSPHIATKPTKFKQVIENHYFTSIDTLYSTVLGTISIKDNYNLKSNTNKSIVTNPNLIKVNFGNKAGHFIIHANPFAFTNYHLLKNNEQYAATVLSFLPKQQIIWDNYYKSGRKVITTPLRYILQNTALKWAFYLSMFGLILFIIFRGKRTQRIIPVINKLENATVDFTKTIGQLYFQYGDYSDIIQKKIQYFLEFVRTKYYINTTNFNPQFIDNLAVKSGNTTEKSKDLVDYIVYLKSKKYHTEQELIKLNENIEHFTNNQL